MKQAPIEVRRRTYAVAAVTVCVLMLSCQSARSGEKDPHEMTALGIISENVRVCPGTSSGITKFSEHEAD